MKIKLLPNWCKIFGIITFVSCFILSDFSHFLAGLTGQAFISSSYNNIFSEGLRHVFAVLSILGLIIYLFSKEKVEDDYINKLRLESFQITALIGLLITIVAFSISKEIELTLDYFIILFLWIYFVSFAIKKRIY